jgi:predicted hydrocarbon binding protein
MDRKDFCKKTLKMCMATGACFFMNGDKSLGKSPKEKSAQEKNDHEQTFKENWIVSLISNLDKQFEQEECEKLMVTCGRDCARRGAIKWAKSCHGDLNKLIRLLDQVPQIEAKQPTDDTIHLNYKTCLCELVSKGPERLPDTYCLCSTGWIHEMFETVLQKPVIVQLIQTQKRGSDSCRFIIQS